MNPHEFSTLEIALTLILIVLTSFSTFSAGVTYQRMQTAGVYMDQARQLNQAAADHELRARVLLQQLQAVPHDQGFEGKGNADQVSGV